MVLTTALIIGGILSAVGGLVGAGLSMADNTAGRLTEIVENKKNRDFTAAENDEAREFASDEAQKQRDWEETMSNTAYQRQIADMRAAGLNPGLMANAGGASTPNAGVAQAHGSGASMVGAGTHGIPGIDFGSLVKGMVYTATKNPDDMVKSLERQAHSALKANKKAVYEMHDDFTNADGSFNEAKWLDMIHSVGGK